MAIDDDLGQELAATTADLLGAMSRGHDKGETLARIAEGRAHRPPPSDAVARAREALDGIFVQALRDVPGGGLTFERPEHFAAHGGLSGDEIERFARALEAALGAPAPKATPVPPPPPPTADGGAWTSGAASPATTGSTLSDGSFQPAAYGFSPPPPRPPDGDA